MRAALLAGDLPNGSRDMQALPRAVLGVLRALAADGPVLIAIDDEQWLDPASARVLAFALCRLLRRRSRDPRAPAAARKRAFDGARSSLRRSWLETIPIAPLPAGALKLLVEARLNRTISRPLLRRIHRGAGGNPLYALRSHSSWRPVTRTVSALMTCRSLARCRMRSNSGSGTWIRVPAQPCSRSPRSRSPRWRCFRLRSRSSRSATLRAPRQRG